MDERERYDKGMAGRREVLGNAHVDRTLSNKTDFNGEFQDLITRYAWGEIWTRPGLPRHTRSLAAPAPPPAPGRTPGPAPSCRGIPAASPRSPCWWRSTAATSCACTCGRRPTT